MEEGRDEKNKDLLEPQAVVSDLRDQEASSQKN